MMKPNGIFIVEPSSGEVKGVTILLHGYGQTLDVMRPIASSLSEVLRDHRIILLNGFMKEPNIFGTYIWFEARIRNVNEWRKRYDDALASFKNYVDELLKENSVSPENLNLVGFSQGAIMALQTGINVGAGKIISIGGVLMDETVMDNKKQASKILMIHNGLDTIVSLSDLELTKDNFKKYNYNIEYYTIPGAVHTIMPQTIELVRDFLYKGQINDKF